MFCLKAHVRTVRVFLLPQAFIIVLSYGFVNIFIIVAFFIEILLLSDSSVPPCGYVTRTYFQ